ncbi:MAG: TIGR04283 family arsenosugar biosynthesis glycosyltransferase [Deltaproteobacteria bacterium]|nr:TIGR04283 family arsenosugar biosynthesis glycosyltransferase [Deltaproteobacteria bacterium]
MKVSVVIPTLDEERLVAETVARAQEIGDEVIVADGGSTDATAARAGAMGARVVAAPRGRGAQLAAGAAVTSGDVLLFLHADVRAPSSARAAMLDALADDAVVGGNFGLRFVPTTFAARCFTVANDLRRRALAIHYGDSGLFVRREVYLRVGGFRPAPLFEDWDLSRRLARAGRVVYLREVVVEASARRFAHAPLRTLAIWTALQLGYSLGVAPEHLARLYEDIR